MNDFDKIAEKLVQFRAKRDWEQFHNPKDMALSLTLEAAEVLEHFQWKNGPEIQEYVEKHRSEIGDELSDVLYWIVLMAHDLEIDLMDAFEKKLKKTAKKYPVKKARGNKKKYTEL